MTIMCCILKAMVPSGLREVVRFAWKKDSDSASCLIIALSSYLSNTHLRDMAEYLREDLNYRQRVCQHERLVEVPPTRRVYAHTCAICFAMMPREVGDQSKLVAWDDL